MKKRVRTTEDFISRATQKHHGKYDYSRVEYKKSKEKVEIICRKHGVFKQTPSNHLHGFGCMKCCVENRAERKRLTLEEFTRIATEVHGDKYEYSNIKYKNRDSKITLYCVQHGNFIVRLQGHLNGVGCPTCDYLSGKNNGAVSITTEQFIEKARRIHGDEYDYSKVMYKGCGSQVVITCPTHGDFLQWPNNHLRGMKCLACVRSMQYHEKVPETYVYLLHITLVDKDFLFLKLGIARDVDKRVSDLHKHLSSDAVITVLRTIQSPSKEACEFEASVHNDPNLVHFWGAGKFGGYTECYSIDELAELRNRLDDFENNLKETI